MEKLDYDELKLQSQSSEFDDVVDDEVTD